MLDEWFRARRVLQGLKFGPAGPFLDGFAVALASAGFRRTTVRDHVNAAAHLGVWAGKAGVVVGEIDEAVLDRFLGHLRKCRCLGRPPGRRHHGTGSRAFLDHLRRTGVAAPRRRPVAEPSPLFTRFRSWMLDRRGVMPSTLLVYERILAKLIDGLDQDVDRLDARSLRTFVLEQAARCGRRYAQLITTAVRMLVRYLVVQGQCPASMIGAVPTVAHWRRAALPRYLPTDAVARIIEACDRSTGAGLRDRAVLLLLARLGLRASDVAALRTSDLDWARGRIAVKGKSRREAWLPLPQDVGDSLLVYLDQARPTVVGQHVFTRLLAPVGPLRSAAVSNIVARAMARAGIDSRFRGAHVLRHSAATALLKQGLPLQGIGVVLRHRDLETTAIYAKVDIPALQLVAQQWPRKGVGPC